MEVESVSHQSIFKAANDDKYNYGVHIVNIVNNQNIRESRNVLNDVFHNIMGQRTKGYVGILLRALQACDTS